jgi:RNA polymerase sigma factor (TIGR02999 family)
LPKDGEHEFGALYAELHAIAAAHMRAERPDHTLQPTALVHEAWLRMKNAAPISSWGNTRFRALAGRTLRRVLVDHARGRAAEKRGGGALPVSLRETLLATDGADVSLLDLDDALGKLARRNARQAQMIELRFFGGLSVEETATKLAVSEDTIKRDWRMARAWLNRELARGAGGKRREHG